MAKSVPAGHRLSFFHSIRFRLTLWFVLILAIVLALFSTFIFWVQTRELRADANGRLQNESARIQEQLGESEWEEFTAAPSTPVGRGGAVQAGDFLVILGPDGSLLQQWGLQLSDPDALIGQVAGTGNLRTEAGIQYQRIRTLAANGELQSADFLVMSSPLMREGALNGYLVLGRRSDLAEQERRLALSLSLGSLAMLVIAWIGGLWLADRAMRPVAAIAHAARDISEGDLGRRLNLGGRDELAVLAGTFDGMISSLQAAFDRQRRFVADASHELRTPLTIINLEVGRTLEGQRQAEEYRKALEVVDQEGRRMARLVNDLMTLARLDAGQSVFRFEPLDLNQIALDSVERLLTLATRHQVTLEALPDHSPVPVFGDRQYLLQMASNLLENGAKYAGAGRTVYIETIRSGDDAVLRVSDTGPGIPPEHLAALFDRFYRVDAARSQDDEGQESPVGSGLGLSIVASIAHGHNGKVKVESHVGEGTTFEVILPLHIS